MNSALKTFFTILVTALVAGGGVYWWQNSGQEAPEEIVEDTAETIGGQETENEVNESEKDYTWSKYDIAFNYPDGWNIYDTQLNIDGQESDGLVVTESEITGDTGGGFEIEVYAVTHLLLEERVDNLSSINSFEDAGQVKFGENTFRLVYRDVFGLRRPLYLIESNGVLYQIHAQNEAVADDVLESLSFL